MGTRRGRSSNMVEISVQVHRGEQLWVCLTRTSENSVSHTPGLSQSGARKLQYWCFCPISYWLRSANVHFQALVGFCGHKPSWPYSVAWCSLLIKTGCWLGVTVYQNRCALVGIGLQKHVLGVLMLSDPVGHFSLWFGTFSLEPIQWLKMLLLSRNSFLSF